MDQTRIYLIFAPFALLLSLVCLVFTLVNLRKNRFLSLLAFLACIFSIILCTILEILASTPDLVLLFSHFSYTFIAILPVSWFLFCIEYTNGPHTRLLRWYSVLLLSIIPALTACLAWTTESHALIWQSSHIALGGYRLRNVVLAYGPWFWVHIAYSYLLYLFGTGQIFKRFFDMRPGEQRPSLLVVFAVGFPIACNLLYVLRLIPGLERDFASLAFSLSGLAFLVSVSRNSFLRGDTIEYRALIGQWAHALILVDAEGRIQDLNAEGQVVVGCDPDSGELISDRIPLSMDEIRAYAADRPGTIREMHMPCGNVYTVEVSAVSLNRGGTPGYSIFLRRPAREGQIAAMSKRELDVYALLLKGMSTKEVASTLCVSENTAKTHIKHIYEKLNVKTRKELFNNTPTPFGGE